MWYLNSAQVFQSTMCGISILLFGDQWVNLCLFALFWRQVTFKKKKCKKGGFVEKHFSIPSETAVSEVFFKYIRSIMQIYTEPFYKYFYQFVAFTIIRGNFWAQGAIKLKSRKYSKKYIFLAIIKQSWTLCSCFSPKWSCWYI